MKCSNSSIIENRFVNLNTMIILFKMPSLAKWTNQARSKKLKAVMSSVRQENCATAATARQLKKIMALLYLKHISRSSRY